MSCGPGLMFQEKILTGFDAPFSSLALSPSGLAVFAGSSNSRALAWCLRSEEQFYGRDISGSGFTASTFSNERDDRPWHCGW